jgi:hypothetical protein
MTVALRTRMGAVQPAAGGPPFTESFNKADGALGPDLMWTVIAGSPVVASNRASFTGSATVNTARAEHDVAAGNQYAQELAYRNGTTSALDRVRLLVCVSASSSEWIYFDAQSSNETTVGSLVGGSFHFESVVSPAFEDGATLRLEIDQATHTARGIIDGITRVTYTVPSDRRATLYANTRGGMGMVFSGGANRTGLDDFEFGEL